MRREGGLLICETPHYVFRTDHEPKVVQLLASHQEALFRELYRRMGKIKPSGQIQRMTVKVFQTEERYKKALGAAATGSQGLFTGYVIGGYGSADDLDRLLEVCRHEGTHQFISQFIGNQCPVWLNEGLAVFFEHAQFEKGTLVIGQVPKYRLWVIQRAISEGKTIPIRNILTMTYEAWNKAVRSGSSQGSVQYSQAWSMVHFLERGGNGKYRTPFLQYIYYLSRGRDSEDAWAKTFGSNLAGFERRWRAYVERLESTTGMTCREKMALLARWILQYHRRRPDLFKDMETFQQAALEGKFGSWKITEPTGSGSYEIREPKAIRDLFHCPEDTSKGDTPSYELVDLGPGQPPTLRCNYHAGYLLEADYRTDPEKNETTIKIISKPRLPGGSGGKGPAKKQ